MSNKVTISHPDIGDQVVTEEHAARMIKRDGRFKVRKKKKSNGSDAKSGEGTTAKAEESENDPDCGCPPK